ncbi:MAG: HipA domain-containing protein [Sphaerochaeta sp.]
MNRCLACYEPLSAEERDGWHRRCSRSFFSLDRPPSIALDRASLHSYAQSLVREGVTTTGVQPKLSVGLSTTKGSAKLTMIDYPAGYILKPQSPEYPHLPELESAAMHLAQSAKIQTVEHGLLRLEDNSLAYITKRIDRRVEDGTLTKIAMEDFCQLSGRLTEDKYKGSYEACGSLIKRHSHQTMLDLTNFFYLLIFSFVIGNNDMHLKNFSLYTSGKGLPSLTPAYDLLPVALALPEDPDEMALTISGKKNRLRRADFIALATHVGILEKVAERLIDRLITMKPAFDQIIDHSFLNTNEQSQLKRLIEGRMQKLAV